MASYNHKLCPPLLVGGRMLVTFLFTTGCAYVPARIAQHEQLLWESANPRNYVSGPTTSLASFQTPSLFGQGLSVVPSPGIHSALIVLSTYRCVPMRMHGGKMMGPATTIQSMTFL